MSHDWFESIAEAQRRAERTLPRSVYAALLAGSEKGVTLRDNVDAFDEIRLAPRTAGLAAARDLSTTVLGQKIALPVLISPTGVQAVHPQAEVAVARAAAARGTAVGPAGRAATSGVPVARAVSSVGTTSAAPRVSSSPRILAKRRAASRGACAAWRCSQTAGNGAPRSRKSSGKTCRTACGFRASSGK